MVSRMPNDDAPGAEERLRLTPDLLRRKSAEALGAFHFKLWLANLLLAPLPVLVGKHFRADIYRLAGFRIGAGSRFFDRATFDALCNPYPNLRIGRRSQVGIGCHFSLNAPVTIGDNVVFGHYVRIITDTHAIGPTHRRCAERIPLSVTIEDGVWIASAVTILPGVTIGAGSVVASGAVVARSVPPNSLVGGVPAQVLRELPAGAAVRRRELLLAEAKTGGQTERSISWK
ncbi:MAG: acyltransferase [Dehalococcoidia bacterium]